MGSGSWKCFPNDKAQHFTSGKSPRQDTYMGIRILITNRCGRKKYPIPNVFLWHILIWFFRETADLCRHGKGSEKLSYKKQFSLSTLVTSAERQAEAFPSPSPPFRLGKNLSWEGAVGGLRPVPEMTKEAVTWETHLHSRTTLAPCAPRNSNPSLFFPSAWLSHLAPLWVSFVCMTPS